MPGNMPDVIICAKFEVKKFRGLGYTWSQILSSPIKMAGHPYNSNCNDQPGRRNSIMILLKHTHTHTHTHNTHMLTLDILYLA